MAGNTFGTLFRLTTFGESHGPAIGGVIDGCPAGIIIDDVFIQMELNRRKPGQSDLTTSRNESDRVQLLSGVLNGISTGAPIGFIIQNEDQNSSDYVNLKDVFRPGHADYTWQEKFGIRDHRGGGRSSARETACRVVAGAIAKSVLNRMNIRVSAYVSSVHKIMVPVAYDNSTQVGINAASNGENIFITLTIRFQTTAKNIVGNLSLRLVDNNLLNFSYVNSGLSFIGNSEVAQGIFLIKETDIAKLKTSRIMTISFKLNDGLLRTYQVNTNADVLKSQVSCL